MKKRVEFIDRVNACFQRNDVRCVYDKQLNEDLAYKVGQATAIFLKAKKIVVGRDMRISSSSLKNALIKGLTDQGVNVIDIGLCSSPMMYFASIYLNMPGGMITASHNPKEYNGIKLVRKNAKPIGDGTGLNKIKEIVLKDQLINKKKIKLKKGKLSKKNLYEEYKKYVLGFVDWKKFKKMNIVVDAGSGMAGKLVPIVFPKNIKLIKQDFKLDGRFPIHEANPLKYKNLKHLMKRVKKENLKSKKVDFGIAFDADVDRVIFVDELGKKVNASQIGALLIKNSFKKKGVVYTSVCSKIVSDTIKKVKGKGFVEKVGHAYVKKRMKTTNSTFGLEHSGHYYYKENHYADSAVITSLLVCEIFSKSNSKFSELIKEFRKYHKAEEKSIKMKDNGKIKRVFSKVETHYKKFKPKISKLDGLKMTFKDFWISVKKSGTEPVIRINVEADNKPKMVEERKKLLSLIKNV